MPPPNDGNEYLPFDSLIKVERLSEHTFKSIALPFHPGGSEGPHGAAYGGHVFMQAAWAASLTVGKGFLLSNVTGHFLLPALPTIRYTYDVQKVRDGRSYCTRVVNVTQAEDKGVMFTSTCVFKTAEDSPIDVQARINVREKYASVLHGQQAHDFPEPSSVDAPWYWKRRKETGHNDAFPGLDMRKVDMAAYNDARHPLDRRQLIFYRSLGTLPRPGHGDTHAANMHLCAHLYASDRNGLFFLANHFDVGDVYAGIGTLVHQVIFHPSMECMLFGEDAGERRSRWFAKEDWASRFAHGRITLHARLSSDEGEHVATIVQDGMLRLPRGKEGELEEIARRWARPEDVTGVGKL